MLKLILSNHYSQKKFDQIEARDISLVEAQERIMESGSYDRDDLESDLVMNENGEWVVNHTLSVSSNIGLNDSVSTEP